MTVVDAWLVGSWQPCETHVIEGPELSSVDFNEIVDMFNNYCCS